MPFVVPVTPAPNVQHFCNPVSSMNVKKLGTYSTNPIKLMKKGPLTQIPTIKDGDILEDVEQIDSNVFRVDISDDTGKNTSYTVIIPVDESSP